MLKLTKNHKKTSEISGFGETMTEIFEDNDVALPGDPPPAHRVPWWDWTGAGEEVSTNAQYWYF